MEAAIGVLKNSGMDKERVLAVLECIETLFMTDHMRMKN